MSLSISILHPTPAAFLYRRVLKSIPKIMILYDLDLPEKEIRWRIKKMFHRHRDVTDNRVLDRVLFRGETELMEALSLQKQKTHVDRILISEEDQ
ncbi:hypothetical protein BASA81_006795 [Batrachochytrium salamandrivorans]|nr:hypothetical protein BASA81_006795 [Batrachochytrium salamandrivorans]